MQTVMTRKHIRYDESDGTKRDVVLAFIAVGSASELPDIDEIDGLLLNEGSGAWDISTGATYGLKVTSGSGEWVKQPNGIPFHFYEEALI